MQRLSKLSTSRGNERSRVWLEGVRLIEHDFVHGATYGAELKGDAMVIRLGKPADGVRARRVAGDCERPIIDITGAWVRETFGAHPYVSVTYAKGRITVRATNEVP